MKKLYQKASELGARMGTIVASTSGELTTDHLGSWLAGVVIVGVLIAAVNAAFPGIFSTMMSTLQSKLNALW